MLHCSMSLVNVLFYSSGCVFSLCGAKGSSWSASLLPEVTALTAMNSLAAVMANSFLVASGQSSTSSCVFLLG